MHSKRAHTGIRARMLVKISILNWVLDTPEELRKNESRKVNLNYSPSKLKRNETHKN